MNKFVDAEIVRVSDGRRVKGLQVFNSYNNTQILLGMLSERIVQWTLDGVCISLKSPKYDLIIPDDEETQMRERAARAAEGLSGNDLWMLSEYIQDIYFGRVDDE